MTCSQPPRKQKILRAPRPKFGQVLAHARYGRAADLWSFGCVVIATWQETGELGWKDTSVSQRKASWFVFVFVLT